MIQTSKRGGARPGAGRKPKPPEEKRKTVSINLPPNTIAHMKALTARMSISQGQLIERLIEREFADQESKS